MLKLAQKYIISIMLTKTVAFIIWVYGQMPQKADKIYLKKNISNIS